MVCFQIFKLISLFPFINTHISPIVNLTISHLIIWNVAGETYLLPLAPAPIRVRIFNHFVFLISSAHFPQPESISTFLIPQSHPDCCQTLYFQPSAQVATNRLIWVNILAFTTLLVIILTRLLLLPTIK